MLPFELLLTPCSSSASAHADFIQYLRARVGCRVSAAQAQLCGVAGTLPEGLFVGSLAPNPQWERWHWGSSPASPCSSSLTDPMPFSLPWLLSGAGKLLSRGTSKGHSLPKRAPHVELPSKGRFTSHFLLLLARVLQGTTAPQPCSPSCLWILRVLSHCKSWRI